MDNIHEITDEEVRALGSERIRIAFTRAEKAFRDCVADYESDAFLDEFGYQIKVMIVSGVIDGLVEKGLLKVAGIDENGELQYEATDKNE